MMGQSPTPASTAPPSQDLKRQEEDDLQLAIAMSLNEQENKVGVVAIRWVHSLSLSLSLPSTMPQKPSPRSSPAPSPRPPPSVEPTPSAPSIYSTLSSELVSVHGYPSS